MTSKAMAPAEVRWGAAAVAGSVSAAWVAALTWFQAAARSGVRGEVGQDAHAASGHAVDGLRLGAGGRGSHPAVFVDNVDDHVAGGPFLARAMDRPAIRRDGVDPGGEPRRRDGGNGQRCQT